MNPLKESDILSGFLKKPKKFQTPDLTKVDWENIEFYSWMHRDQSICYLTTIYKGKPITLSLNISKGAKDVKTKICTLCNTLKIGSQISLFTYTIKRPEYKSFGEYFCSDLQCSQLVRGMKSGVAQMQETISTEEKILRLQINLEKFIASYLENAQQIF